MGRKRPENPTNNEECFSRHDEGKQLSRNFCTSLYVCGRFVAGFRRTGRLSFTRVSKQFRYFWRVNSLHRKVTRAEADRSFSQTNGHGGCWLSHSDMQIECTPFFRADREPIDDRSNAHREEPARRPTWEKFTRTFIDPSSSRFLVRRRINSLYFGQVFLPPGFLFPTLNTIGGN